MRRDRRDEALAGLLSVGSRRHAGYNKDQKVSASAQALKLKSRGKDCYGASCEPSAKQPRVKRSFGGVMRTVGKVGLPLLGAAFGPEGEILGQLGASFLKKGGRAQPNRLSKLVEKVKRHEFECQGHSGMKTSRRPRLKRAAGGIGKMRKGYDMD